MTIAGLTLLVVAVVIVVGMVLLRRRRTGKGPGNARRPSLPRGAEDVTAANRAIYRAWYNDVASIAADLDPDREGRWVPFEDLTFLVVPDVNPPLGYYHDSRTIKARPGLELAEGGMKHEIAHAIIHEDHNHPIFADPRMAV